MDTITDYKKNKKRLILIIALLVMLTSLIIYLMTRSMSKEEQFYKSQMEQMSQKLEQLDGSLKSLKKDHKKLNHERDSLKRNVDYLWPMRSLVYNAKLRDKVGAELDLRPGDLAMVKTDSTKVVVTDIIVGGNQYTYYVHYLIRNAKGESKEMTPFELKPFKL